ncbi:HesB/YadR/YfhF family protein [Paenibacillus agilis]|uniref:Fe-S cluster assembly protein HesB n=1 Tax=Paenibacillus agilis TaxID=3020863 RepID=A0A559J0S5_9BACL|nr:hypothetical protein [Paenibacillus agilis]TVX93441.1 hypothetical protein FPZ44_10480 [Paenibacillus agilis]
MNEPFVRMAWINKKWSEITMEIIVSENAIRSFQQEWGLADGQYVRVYAKYVGASDDAFSIGINASADPIDPALVKSIGGYQFFIEHSDAWKFKNRVLNIDSNEDGIFFQ